MTSFKHARAALTALAFGMIAVAAPHTALAGNQASGTYRIRATVPVACWVRASGSVMAESGRSGSVVEACNSPGGFTVSASYRPLTVTEKARMVYGDRTLDLASSGDQVLRRSSMATIREVNYRFDEVELEAPLILALTIQPI